MVSRGFPIDSGSTRSCFRLPKLSHLWVVIQGRNVTPVTLLNLAAIDLKYDDCLDWLQGFRREVHEKLEAVYSTSRSERIGDFLEELKNATLTTSVPITPDELMAHTLRSRVPSYPSLLPFVQLKDLLIGFACDNVCSEVDNIVMDLAREMRRLEILRLGGAP